MKKLKIYILLAAALLIIGCGSKIPFKEQRVLENSSLVYIYVPQITGFSEGGSYHNYLIRINNKKVANRVSAGEYTTLDLKPNKIKLSATRASIEEKALELELQEGKTYYLRVLENAENGSFVFERVSAEIGAAEIAKTGVAGSMIDDIDNTLTELVGGEKTDAPQQTQVQTPVAPISKIDELQKAYELKEKGIISEEEFKTLKSQIISK